MSINAVKLVMIYQIGDGCTFSCTETIPVEYDSPEAFIVDFMDAVEKAHEAHQDFIFLNKEFSPSWFMEGTNHYDKKDRYKGTTYHRIQPEVLTVEEWFQQY